MELIKNRQSGFTLVELMSSIVVGTIMALSFGSVLMLIQDQTSVSNDIVDLKRNTEVIDRFVTERMAMCYGDSTRIYYNYLAEWLGIESDVGGILHLTDVNGNDYRINTNGGNLQWNANNQLSFPIDMRVENLIFQKISTTHANRLKLSMDLVTDNESINYGRMVYIRN